MSIFRDLLKTANERGGGYIVLIDPDKLEKAKSIDLAAKAARGGADAIFVGSSMLLNSGLDDLVKAIKNVVDIPVIMFPGSTMQICKHADAILFLSLISGRNPYYLIGEQVKAAPIIRHHGVEPISTGYMLIESGKLTSAEFMSNTRAMPRGKFDIAKATALAAQYLGMKMIYLEAGSGAEKAVKVEMVREVSDYVNLPVIVGGGLRKPEQARARVEAGANFIVTGNVLESNSDLSLIRAFAEATHVNE